MKVLTLKCHLVLGGKEGSRSCLRWMSAQDSDFIIQKNDTNMMAWSKQIVQCFILAPRMLIRSSDHALYDIYRWWFVSPTPNSPSLALSVFLSGGHSYGRKLQWHLFTSTLISSSWLMLSPPFQLITLLLHIRVLLPLKVSSNWALGKEDKLISAL